MKKFILATFAAIILAAAPAWAGSSPRGSFDQCQGKPLAFHVEGWAYEPDIPSLNITVMVYLYTDSGCTTQYGDAHALSANQPRPDVNQALGIAGDHGFVADIPVPDAGTYWVKVWGVDMTGDLPTQIGSTRSVTVADGTPQGRLDECQGGMGTVHVTGWAYDPNVPSQSIDVHVRLYTDSACTSQYGDTRVLSASRPRSDVNEAESVAGDHGFVADLPVPDAGTYWVKVFAIDTNGDGNPQIGTTRSVTVAADTRGMVRLWADGPYWAETNVGADEPWEDGWHFWWGDTVGYRYENDAWVASDGSSSNFSFGSGNTPTYGKDNATMLSEGWITADAILAPSHDAAHVKWGGDWRMPTRQELAGLLDNCDWTWTTTNGISGYVVRGRGEYSAASIFLMRGEYWSSVPEDDDPHFSRGLYFDGSVIGIYRRGRYFGYSVRPVATGSVAISFDANGGSASMASEAYMPGMAYGPLPSATREGYTFAGWFTAADGGTQVTAASTVPASDATLHAHWTGNQYAVTFVTGGTGGTESVTATYGSPMPAIAVPTRPGGVFDGYVDVGGTQYYTASGASARNWDIAEATWLFSRWTPIQYAVTLDGQGGTGGTERVTAEYGYPMPTIAVPTRPGYEFRGYYTGADGAGTRYYKASGESARSWDLTDDATLYAKWTVPGAPRGKVQLWEGGPFWAETNIGADEPWDYGLYFWWGDTVGYEWKDDAWAASDGSVSDLMFYEGTAPTYGKDWATLQSEGWITGDNGDPVLTPAHDAARAHWGGDWRMPTGQELADLISNCDWTWTTTNHVSGYVVRGLGEYSAASIFLPAAGYAEDIDCYEADLLGGYLSSVPEYNDPNCSWSLDFSDGVFRMYCDVRWCGHSVRPVQSAPTAYDIWASANGVTGAWDATDANGVHNIFRYAFNVPSGAFTNPPLLSIHFENGAPVVVTPPLVNTNGYGFAILGYDSLTNAEASLSCRPSPDGTNAITGAVLPACFFRLWAGEGNQVIK